MAAPHYEMIVAAYAIAFVVISGMWAAILADRSELRRGLAQLEKPQPPTESGVD